MNTKRAMYLLIPVLAIIVFLSNACSPLKEFGRTPVYTGDNSIVGITPKFDNSKKTVVIIANNAGTELFDMMAPFYLFNTTEKANVYIVAKSKEPIVIKKGFFVLPQFTFSEIDSLGIKPDAMVIPFLSVADSIHQDPLIIGWIKNHYTSQTMILSVCDGAATAAATGIFDGKPMTAHASDFAGIKAQFSKPQWVQNISVAGGDNLYSTAGVSNAVEGSLMVINKMWGEPTMLNVAASIGYQPVLKTGHKSEVFHFSDKCTVGKKIIFSKNKRIGVLLQPGIDEFELAAVMDTYNRTFPKSLESFSITDSPVITKHGLTLIPTTNTNNAHLDELHVIAPFNQSLPQENFFTTAAIIKHERPQNQYIIDICLQDIKQAYGSSFEHIVKLMLDYN